MLRSQRQVWHIRQRDTLTVSQIDKVDPKYFQATTRVDIDDETKVKATKEEAEAYYATDESNRE
jgi:hypothetical protein